MTRIAFRSPVTTELRRKGQCSPASDAFCVTQQFADPDFYWSNIDPAKAALGHRATDIGNFRCGYPIVAMAAGTAWRVQDNATALGAASNALGIVIDHGSGVRSAYWHLASWTAANGAAVNAGQEIGKLGATGLGATCHTHIEMTVDGVKVDPEPHMFGAPLLIGEDADSIMLNKAEVTGLHGITLLTKAGTRVREAPNTTGRVIFTFPAGIELVASAVVTGQFLDLGEFSGNQWFAVWVEENDKTLLGFAHDSTVTRKPAPIAPPPTGFTQAQVDAARIEGTSIGFSRAKTKAAAAVGAIEP